MYTKLRYSVRDMLLWTRRETLVLVFVATVPVVLFEVLDQKWLHLPWLPIALIGTAVAFIIGFQNNATYGRLWEARKIWGGIVNTSRFWALQVNDFITNDFTEQPASADELSSIRKELILRHLAWMTALRHAMRQPRPWEAFLKSHTNREWSKSIGIREHRVTLEEDIAPYLTPEERGRVLSQANPAAQLLAGQSRRLRALRTRGLVEDFRHMEMENVLGKLLDLQGASERIKNFPYPRQYATLNSMFLWIFVLLLPLGVMYEFDKIGDELSALYPGFGPYFIWLAVPFSVIVMWVFHTMERIGRVSENPFEGNPNDVPITTMARGIEIDLRQMIGDDPASIPAPLEAARNAQT